MLLLLLLLFGIVEANFPLFKQCDPIWGSDKMGTDGPGERSTICREGCAMSSLSMAMNGLGIEIDGKGANPGTLNSWLIANTGYHCLDNDCNNLVLDAVERITDRLVLVGEINPPPVEALRAGINNASSIFLAHLPTLHHFVLLTGWDDESASFTVNDPFFNTTNYFFSNFSDVIEYKIVPSMKLQYPLLKQCDPKWGGNTMGVVGPGERSTICGEGCAMSALSAALQGLGVTLQGAEVNPGSLNAWLIANQGYHCVGGDCNNLVLDAIQQFTAELVLDGEAPKPTIESIRDGLDTFSKVYLAHDPLLHHFVLLTGWNRARPNSTYFYVNDPFFNYTSYNHSNFSDMIVYSIAPPMQYPLFKQCDQQWGSDVMGGNGETICQVGCLMSSTSMALNGWNITIDGADSNPKTLNKWLQAHNGYAGNSSAFDESVLPQLAPGRIVWPADGMHRTPDLPWTTVQNYLAGAQRRVVIANVNGGHHFVLVVGTENDGDSLKVNDPGFNRATYSFSKDVVGWRLFDMH